MKKPRRYLAALTVAALAGTGAAASCDEETAELIAEPLEILAKAYGLDRGPVFCDTFTEMSVSVQGLSGPLEPGAARKLYGTVLAIGDAELKSHDAGTWEMIISWGHEKITLLHDLPSNPIYSEWMLPQGTEYVLSLVLDYRISDF